jgi:hypothetical protein
MATLLPLNTFESDAGDLILLWHFKISSKFKHQKTSRATVAPAPFKGGLPLVQVPL